MRLGCCYYPEHWPEAQWADDARAMAAMGLERVRIGEFAWSRIEPAAGRYDWGWLDRAIATLADAGLGIILGTPTATPPKWLVDRMPDMIAIDANGRPRRFGSRRHYCFSHQGYARACARIVTALAARYGQHPAIVGWQTDNEYGCHDTAVSYSDAAAAGFRHWLAAHYADIAALNAAWGNVFWSMDYADFAAIDLPNLMVTEANPAHVMDFRRFCSDEVVKFNRAQVDILRHESPGRAITHNFMGFFTQFDHHAVARDLDVVTWDSYPLGFLDQFAMFSAADKARYERQGHPDIAAFHHDLYRGCAANGRWGVMEQQPGPVNWARHNPAPLPGMVRLWTLEAMAHGAELVSYFRWRQAPFAQEQMHSGLHRPDGVEDVAAAEVRAAVADIAGISAAGSAAQDIGAGAKARGRERNRTAALVFSYPAAWAIEIQPQGAAFQYLPLVLACYTALRRLGIDVDIVAPAADFAGYAMVVVPTLPMVDAALAARLATLACPVLLGPRTGSKTDAFAIPANLPPGPLQAHLPLKVVRVESRRDGQWIDHVETDLPLTDGAYRHRHLRYLPNWPTPAGLATLVRAMAQEAGLPIVTLPPDLRLRRRGDVTWLFNYGPEAIDIASFVGNCALIVGAMSLPPAGVAAWISPPA